MNSSDFETEYARLNTAQKRAVDTIEGPVMVIAGPGTGKTQILTLRIANILKKTDAPPDSILALTFTEAAAANMRRRLTRLIGSAGYYVAISTFHGFCNALIREYPEEFPAIISSSPATQLDQISIIQTIIDEGNFEILKPFGSPYYFVPDILTAIKSLKNEGHDPAAFSRLIIQSEQALKARPDLYHEKGVHAGKIKGEYQKQFHDLEKNKELSRIYEKYQIQMREHRAYDFDDMILETTRAFEARKNFLLQVQERYHYVLVDEHQDTNGAQNRVLEQLINFHPHPNVFVVGDEKQAIFRFQGASLENFLYFKRTYPAATLINLEENYRSTQLILDASQSVIDQNHATLKAPLSAHGARGEQDRPISVHEFPSVEAEVSFVADEIDAKIKAGEEAAEIAVLFRLNRDSASIARELERRSIPYNLESDQNIAADPEIQKLIVLFEAIAKVGDEEKLTEALHIDFLDLDPLDTYKLLHFAGTHRESVWRLIGNPDSMARVGVEDASALLSFASKLKQWKRRAHNEEFLKFFERVIRESGFLAHLLGTSIPAENLEKLHAFFAEAKKLVGNRGDYKLADFLAHLALIKEHGVLLRAPLRRAPGRVRLMTAHRAKGLEFDVVFIVGAVDGQWGNRREMTRFRLPFETTVMANELERNEDERRLFYMALTRARREVVVSYHLKNTEGREVAPSQFVGEIDPRLVAVKTHVEDVSPERFFEASAPARREDSREKIQPFVCEIFAERGLSATALNNYLSCPWKYFYANLLRIPSAGTRFQFFGTAAHAALQKFFNGMHHARYGAEGSEEPGDAFLPDQFERELTKMPIRIKDFEALREKGRRVLAAYYARYRDEWNYNVLTELRLANSIPFEEGREIKITGSIDKIERTANSREVVVVDYKMKSPESRNWIEGKVGRGEKGSLGSRPGDYKRQLVFYKLLLDRHPAALYHMKEAVIDFVEPNERGIFKKEAFEITDTEVGELEAVIARVAHEIDSLSFWDARCDTPECSYCRMRETMSSSHK